MPSNFTENYQLSQWVKSDQVQMEDFNADNAAIDAALKGKGNGSVDPRLHKGNGKSGPDSPSIAIFNGIPDFVVLADHTSGKCVLFVDGCDQAYNPDAPNSPIFFSYTINPYTLGSTFHWYSDTPEHQFNIQGHFYTVIGFYRSK